MIRRFPAAVRRISDISDEPRVSVVGTVIRCGPAEFILDDGTGQLTVVTSEGVQVKERGIVRVIGKVYGKTMEAEIVQEMDDLNMQLYVKMYELRKKVFK